MKICMFVFNTVNPDIRVFKEARTLTKAGHDVRIIAFLSEGSEPYEERDGFRIFRVTLDPIHSKILRLILLPGRLAENLVGSQGSKSAPRSLGPNVYSADSSESLECSSLGPDVERANSSVPRRLGLASVRERTLNVGRRGWMLIHRAVINLLRLLPTTYLSYLDYYYRGFRLARQEPADVYHAHDLNTLPVAWLSRRFNNGKVVYDSHELWLDRNRLSKRSRFNRLLVQRIESFLIRRTDATITVSESIAKVLSTRYHIVAPTVVLNAPNYQRAQRSGILRDELEISVEDRIVLYIGRITSKRGLEELVQSIQYLERCSLVIMGYGPAEYIAGLKTLIKDEGVTNRVYFFGPVPPEEVVRYAASADVGVVGADIACLSYYYSCPNKFFESVAAGLPMAVVDIPHLKALVEEYDMGVTFDPEYPRDIANAINYILSDESRYEEMSKNALEAAKIFNWENESKKLLALYEGLSGKPND